MAAKRVYIVGFAPTWNQTPFEDQDAEVWALNEFYKLMEKHPGARADRWFEIHSRNSPSKNTEEHIGWLKQAPIPVYMWEHYDDIPSSVRFPKEEIVNWLREKGFNGARYFTNSISWMIALALYEGFEEVHVYGVDMATDSEYCVAPNTKVLTADLRWIPASDVHVGDELMGFDEEIPTGKNFRYWRKTRVLAAKRLTRPSYRLEMADGTELISSAEHRWLEDHAQYRWTTTENLRPPIVTAETYSQLNEAYANGKGTIKELSERFGVSWQAAQRITSGHYKLGLAKAHRLVKLTDMWEPDRSWGAGLLAGAFDSEGHLTQIARKKNNGVIMSLGFSQKENPLSAAVMRELDQRGFVVQGAENKGCWRWVLAGAREKARTRRDEILRFLGSIRPPRLLNKFDPDRMGVLHKKDGVRIVRKTFIGEQEVIGLHTTTGTFVANGFASHNSHQRPSCEYILGIAEGMGIKVYIPPESDLLKTSELYGFESDNSAKVRIKSRIRELDTRLNQLRQEEQKLQGALRQNEAAKNQIVGAMEDAKYWLKNWTQ